MDSEDKDQETIRKAKAALMDELGMTEDKAHGWLIRTSMERRIKKVDLATAVVVSRGKLRAMQGTRN